MRTAEKIFTGTAGDGTAVIVDMGLGKTFAVLQGIADLINWGVITKPVLVVAPIAVCSTVWRQEASGWSSTRWMQFSLLRGSPEQRRYQLYRPAHVYLVNPELLEWLYKELRETWDRFEMLVVDESSMFKSHSSRRFKLLTNYGDRHTVKGADGKSIKDADGHSILVGPHKFKRTVIMTGTPAPTSLLNLWPQFYVVDHGKRLHTSFEQYRERFFYKQGQVAEHVDRYGLGADEFEPRPDWMPKDGAPIKIHELIADATVELSAEDYGVLPATIGDASKGGIPPSHLHYVTLPADIRELYDKMEKDALIELGKDFIMAANGGAKSMLCHQIANGFIYKTNDFGYQETEALHALKTDKLIELIETLNTNVIVTYHFKADKERIQRALKAAGISYGVLTSKNSERMLKLWNGGNLPVMLLHPQSAGHGINAQEGGHTIIWYSQIWSLERYQQTNARIARSGQKNIVAMHHICAFKTVDELMLMTYLERGEGQDKFRSALRKYQDMRGWNVRDFNDMLPRKLEDVL
jgi:SNF2 family DNA or RNA helicase